MMGGEYDNIALFALVETLHEENDDMFSVVCSLVIGIFADDCRNVNSLKKTFKDEYSTDIPKEMLRSIVKRLRRKGLVSYDKQDEPTITEAGKVARAKLQESVKSLSRDFGSVVSEMIDFFRNKKYPVPANSKKALIDFVDGNISFTSATLTGKSTPRATSHIAEFLVHLEKKEPEKFSVFQNIFLGRLYISVLKVRNEYAKNTKLEPIKIYLDTNVLLPLIGLDSDEINEVAKELFSILKQTNNVSVCVFDETISESIRLLEHAKSSIQNIDTKTPVDSIYYHMKLKGYSSEKLTLLMESLEDKIEAIGVTIENIPMLDESAVKAMEGDISSASMTKNNKSSGTLEHDAKVFCAVGQLRGKRRAYLFEKCVALFVSRDYTLSKVATNLSSSNDRSYPVAVDIMGLTSNLWLRDLGNERISTNILRQGIMGHIREQAISQELWDKFILKLEETEKSGSISREDVAIIVSAKDTSRLLAEEQDAAVDKVIKPEYIKRVRAHAAERDTRLNISEKKLKRVSDRAKTLSRGIANGLLIIFGVIIVAMICAFFYLFTRWIGLGVAADIITLVVLAIGVILLVLFGKNPNEIFRATRNKTIGRTSRITYSLVCKLFNIEKEKS